MLHIRNIATLITTVMLLAGCGGNNVVPSSSGQAKQSAYVCSPQPTCSEPTPIGPSSTTLSCVPTSLTSAGGGSVSLGGSGIGIIELSHSRGLKSACVPISLATKIFNAANNFFGTKTCGINNAPTTEECMAAVNQILMNAKLSPLGPGSNGSNLVPVAILSSLASGRLAPISQSSAVLGDLTVRHTWDDTYTSKTGDEHIGVCTTNGCTTVLSNSAHAPTGNPNCPEGVFNWKSPWTMDNYTGSKYKGGYSDFYHLTR
jgi:uncharacterized protein YceK